MDLNHRGDQGIDREGPHIFQTLYGMNKARA
jgi:hypothetical protein